MPLSQKSVILVGFSLRGSSFATSMLVKETNLNVVLSFSFLSSQFETAVAKVFCFSEPEKPPLSLVLWSQAPLTSYRAFSGIQTVVCALGGSWPTPITQWPEQITRRIGAICPAPPPWQPTGKKDKLAIQIIGFLPASFPNKKAGIAAEVQRVFVAYSGGKDLSSSCSSLSSAARKGKDGGCFLCHLEADRQSEFWWVHEGFG